VTSDRARARALAEQALAAYESRPEGVKVELDEIRRWLADRPR